ncbi:MAG: lysozyme [Gammaproteobacteria bacterium]|nr:MAG: lysozyme [Gammaproteobacteria bacterium]
MLKKQLAFSSQNNPQPYAISLNGIDALRKREGVRTHAYRDSAGKLTIGVGHLLTPWERLTGTIKINGYTVKWRKGIDHYDVTMLMRQDLTRFENAVNQLVTVPLNQNQYDALVSFCFNIGIRRFKRSTLLRKLNHGLYNDVPHEMRRWRKARGHVIQGLVNRRESEVKQWEKK